MQLTARKGVKTGQGGPGSLLSGTRAELGGCPGREPTLGQAHAAPPAAAGPGQLSQPARPLHSRYFPLVSLGFGLCQLGSV